MTKRYELAGQRFGKLLVIEKNGYDSDFNIKWLCKCDCGNTAFVSGRGLVKKGTKSCGCLHKEIVSIIASAPKKEETRKKMSVSGLKRFGHFDEAVLTQSGWYDYEKRIKKGDRYLRTRRNVLERDNFKCTKCEENDVRKLDTHHIEPWCMNIDLRFDESNIITLCKTCHRKEPHNWKVRK